MKIFLFILIMHVFYACHDHNKNISANIIFKFPDSVLQEKIGDTLRTFPFVKRSQAYFDSVSYHTRGITFTMDTFRNKIYPIAVYVDEDNHFEKLYRFEINPVNMEIKINDINTGNYITIEEYYKLDPQAKY